MVETKPSAEHKGPGLHVLTAHGDCVTALPEGAVVLASSPSTAVELWALGADVLAQQGHPECCGAQFAAKVVPGLLASEGPNRLSPAEAQAVLTAFERPTDHPLLLAMGRFFLRGEETAGGETPAAIAAAIAAAAATPLGEVPADEPSVVGEGVAEANVGRMPSGASGASVDALLAAGAEVLRGELQAHDSEVTLLAALNTAAAAHYGGLADLAAGLGVFAQSLAAKDASFAPFLGVMEAIEAQVGELEAVVSTLDGYTRRLESRLGALQTDRN